VLLSLGHQVSGSVLGQSETVRRSRELGGTVFIGHDASNIGDAHVVVVSSAVPPTNPEVVAAKAKVIPVIPRAEMLGELMRLKYGVAIAGAHGKTTTTSLVANVLAEGGLDPTIVIGGKVNALGSHARLGRGDLLVAEADESDGSFMKLSPTVVVVTNVDREHLDHYGTMERLCETFLDFINKVPFYGLSVLCAGDRRRVGAGRDNPAHRPGARRVQGSRAAVPSAGRKRRRAGGGRLRPPSDRNQGDARRGEERMGTTVGGVVPAAPVHTDEGLARGIPGGVQAGCPPVPDRHLPGRGGADPGRHRRAVGGGHPESRLAAADLHPAQGRPRRGGAACAQAWGRGRAAGRGRPRTDRAGAVRTIGVRRRIGMREIRSALSGVQGT